MLSWYLQNRKRNIVSQVDTRIAFFLAIIAIVSAAIGIFSTRLSPQISIGAVAGCAVGLITLFNTDLGLGILIFSMLLSPEIPIAQTPERAVVLRVDDFLIVTVFLVWLAKVALRKDIWLVRSTPLNRVIGFYMLANVVSTGLGIASGDVTLARGFFYLLKYTEFFIIYFLFVNNISEVRQIKFFLGCFLTTFFIIGILTYAQAGKTFRPSAPFEGPHPEPNTLGIYLMMGILFAIGLALHRRASNLRLLLAGLACFNIYPLLITLSRSAYLGFAFAYAMLILFAKRGKLILLTILSIYIVAFPVIMPKTALGRIAETFTGPEKLQLFDVVVQLDKSAAARFQTWEGVAREIKKKPLFGFGIGGIGFIDSQYVRILADIGILGFLVFIWMMFRIFISSAQIYLQQQDDFAKGVSLGFLCAFLGLSVAAFGAAVFVIVRVAEPMWFLAACVMALPKIQELQGPQAAIESGQFEST